MAECLFFVDNGKKLWEIRGLDSDPNDLIQMTFGIHNATGRLTFSIDPTPGWFTAQRFSVARLSSLGGRLAKDLSQLGPSSGRNFFKMWMSLKLAMKSSKVI